MLSTKAHHLAMSRKARRLTCLGVACLLVGSLACGGGGASPDSPRPARGQTVQEAHGEFRHAGHLVQPRMGLAAVAVSTDRILIMGGSATPGGPRLNTAEIYTLSNRRSSLTHAMNFARTDHAVVRLSPAHFLVTGGAGSCGTSELYDSGPGLFTPAGAMACERSRHSATALGFPPTVLIAGGVTAGGTPAPIAERFDPTTNTFSSAGTLALNPGHTATPLPNGKVLLVSHTSSGSGFQPFASLYDPATGTITATAGQPISPREGHQALLLANPSKVLILGGNGGHGPLGSAEWYDPATDQFTRCSNPMICPRQDFGASVLGNGQVLLLGGSTDGTTASASAELFNPISETFRKTGSMTTPRRHPAVLVMASGEVLVLGGSNETQGCLSAIEVYSDSPKPPQQPWAPLPDPSQPPKPPQQPWSPLPDPSIQLK